MSTDHLSYTDLLVASSLIFVAGSVSFFLKLGLTKALGVASLRMVIQLTLLGAILQWIFSLEHWYLVMALMGSMLINAGTAAVRRTKRRFRGIYAASLLSVTISAVLTTFVVVEIVIDVTPWYEPRYVIPILGMVLGNSLTGLSLCLDRVMLDLAERRDVVEARLALGATAWEACRPHIQEAIRTGMIPILNSMSVVGLVSLPGMMTGQILAGESPKEAVKYQIVVMCMIAAASALGALLAGLFAFRYLTTEDHQIAKDRLREV